MTHRDVLIAPPVDVLIEALDWAQDIIRDRGSWCQGASVRVADGEPQAYDALGALARASATVRLMGAVDGLDAIVPGTAIFDTCREALQANTGGWTVPEFNDAASHAHVVALFTRAKDTVRRAVA